MVVVAYPPLAACRASYPGDQFVQLDVVLPPGEEPELAEFLKTWKPGHPFNPREGK